MYQTEQSMTTYQSKEAGSTPLAQGIKVDCGYMGIKGRMGIDQEDLG